jgi:AraC-like DNA-binding protein
MISLPIPLIVSLLLAFMLVRAVLVRESHWTLLGLIAIAGIQSLIIALHQYYGFQALRPMQAIGAMFIPPAAWFAFGQAAHLRSVSKLKWLHLLGPVLAVFALLTMPDLLDALIPVSFAGYGVAMMLTLMKGEDSLPHSRLESGSLPLKTWFVLALALVGSAVCDGLIAWSFATGGTRTMLFAGVASSMSLLGLGALSLTHAIESRRSSDDFSDDVESQEDDVRNQDIVTKLETLMTEQRVFLDPDLTLSRLSRKLVVPAKQVSTAINRVHGENVSRFINRKRIEHACGLLEKGVPVTAAIYESGFNTKSNFNREFLRVKDMPPSQWSSALKL